MIMPWPLAMKTIDKINNADHQQKLRTSNNKGQYEIDINTMIAISNKNIIENIDNKPIRETRMQTDNAKTTVTINTTHQQRTSKISIDTKSINTHP